MPIHQFWRFFLRLRCWRERALLATGREESSASQVWSGGRWKEGVPEQRHDGIGAMGTKGKVLSLCTW
eukprot:577798-Pleurochrysis_carterae.AAC.2